MSDDGDRTCPLCAEDMDITDQQLKPCKCGYEICVWCWHHIMEMAEKEETEGRCPACRTRYDKDRIVKMAANCERMVAEFAAEKKQKPQKIKAKSNSTTDVRNHLSSVRVIQRNLVYIIGLPNNLMDESLLERREYFGQYGKVMKVSISRPTGAAAQQALVNNTFSVYITYAREEEAVRCIQAVHNFILEGKSLRACFGTTKYCHQWLRNLSCNNPDCLYLHDIGSQEDSFTKDEIISAYTRVPQIVLNASLRRVGNILPAPADDFPSIPNPIPTKPPLKNGSNSVTTQAKISPPNSSSGKSTLPAAAAWGLRNIGSRPASVPPNVGPSNPTLIKQKSDPTLNINTNPNSNINPKQPSSAWHDDIIPTASTSSKIPDTKQTESISKSYKSGISKELDIDLTNIPSAWNDDPPIVSSKSYESNPYPNPNLNSSPNLNSNLNSNTEVSCSSTSPLPRKNSPFIEPTSESLSSRLSSVCLDTDTSFNELVSESETLYSSISNNLSHTNLPNPSPKPGPHEPSLPNPSPKPGPHEPSLSNHSHKPNLPNPPLSPCLHEPGLSNHSHKPSLQEPSLSNHSHKPSLQETFLSNHSHKPSLQETFLSNHSHKPSVQETFLSNPSHKPSLQETFLSNPSHKPIPHEPSLPPTNNHNHSLSPGPHEPSLPTTNYNPLLLRDNSSLLSPAGGKTVNSTEENNIISDILSLDFDPWDESANINNNLTAPWRCKSTGQSRFLFARQEELLEGSGNGGLGFQNGGFDGGVGNGGLGFVRNGTGHAGNTRSKVSAPPGFSTPSRVIPPPGFSSHDRSSNHNHFYDSTYTDNRILESQYQQSNLSNFSRNSPDLEFIDPAILAVGKGRISALNEPNLALNDPKYHFNSSPTDPRIQMLMQQALASQNPRMPDQHLGNAQNPRMTDQHLGNAQNPRMTDQLNSYLSLNDGTNGNFNGNYGSRFLGQNYSQVAPHQHQRASQFTNGNVQWDQWSDLRMGSNNNNTIGMSDILRNERAMLNSINNNNSSNNGNNLYGGNEESGFHLPGQNDLFNRAFGL